MGLWTEESSVSVAAAVRKLSRDLLYLTAPKSGYPNKENVGTVYLCERCAHGALLTKLPYTIADYGATIRPFLGEG